MKIATFKKNMTKIFFLFTLSLYYPFFSFAQTDIAVKNLQKHIAYLASDKLEGRGTGSTGERKAANTSQSNSKKLA